MRISDWSSDVCSSDLVGALTVGIITKPFGFEGSRRAGIAEEGVALVADVVDTMIVVPNNRLLTVLDRHTSMVDAFAVADDVLRQGVQGVTAIGRAQGRGRVCQSVLVWGGAVTG